MAWRYNLPKCPVSPADRGEFMKPKPAVKCSYPSCECGDGFHVCPEATSEVSRPDRECPRCKGTHLDLLTETACLLCCPKDPLDPTWGGS